MSMEDRIGMIGKIVFTFTMTNYKKIDHDLQEEEKRVSSKSFLIYVCVFRITSWYSTIND